MGTLPPYLFSAGTDDSQEAHLALVSDVDTATIEMTVHGRWHRRLCVDLSIAIRKCLAEHPYAVIIDVSDLADQDGASMPFWLSERRIAAGMLPPVNLVLCLPPATVLANRLRKVGAHWFLAAYPTMGAARAALSSRAPLTDLVQLRLPAEPAALDKARRLVDQACQAWGLTHLQHPARLVLCELVSNAVEHAGTNMLVTVSRRGAGLHLSVRDGDPRMPGLIASAPRLGAEPVETPGQGLRGVHSCAFAWGAMPARVGKVVWATVRHSPSRA